MKEFIQISGNTLTIGNLVMTFSVGSIIEILIFTVASYYLILWIKKTKAFILLKGILALIVVYVLAMLFHLDNIAYLFKNLFESVLLAVIVIFQPEIRKALESLGNKNILKGIFSVNASSPREEILKDDSIDDLVQAMSTLGKNKVGALVVIERNIVLDEYIETGIRMNADITQELLEQIFVHDTPLHDGAVIIRRNCIEAATCYLPLSQNQAISKQLGTRHRAGIGISEVSDCVTLIASEETGAVSAAVEGRLYHNVKPDRLREILVQNCSAGREGTSGGLMKLLKGRQKNEE